MYQPLFHKFLLIPPITFLKKGFGLWVGLGKLVRGKWGWGWGLKIYPWTRMEMKIIPANEGGPGMDRVFLSGYGDGDYTLRPRSGPLPSLIGSGERGVCMSFSLANNEGAWVPSLRAPLISR